jgi:hypothetical protein
MFLKNVNNTLNIIGSPMTNSKRLSASLGLSAMPTLSSGGGEGLLGGRPGPRFGGSVFTVLAGAFFGGRCRFCHSGTSSCRGGCGCGRLCFGSLGRGRDCLRDDGRGIFDLVLIAQIIQVDRVCLIGFIIRVSAGRVIHVGRILGRR